MTPKGTLLIVDDNTSILSSISMLLSAVFKTVLTLDSPKQLITTIRQHKVDVVLLDMNFNAGINTGNEGLYWLSEIKKQYGEQCQVVLFTAYADIDLAVRGMKIGAADFIVKPWDNEQLTETLQTVYQRMLPRGKRTAAPLAQAPSMFWGDTPEMRHIKELISKVAPTDANILITGENGTGKDVLAHEIHRLSMRAAQDMMVVDMGAVSPTLFESELFGHKKGAFTDAHSDRLGKFQQADASTLFMDEVGNLPLALQGKMLSALQTRQVTPLGANKPVDIDVRLIAATNCDLPHMVQEGTFRIDLMYRLNTVTIHIPPLRDRRADIIPLAQLFLAKYNAKYKKNILEIDQEAQALLLAQPWKGNVRELQHTIEKAVIIASTASITPSDLSLQTTAAPSNTPQNPNPEAPIVFSTLEEMEKGVIMQAIDQYESNLSVVSSMLGISRQTLYNKMKKYNI